MFNLLCFRLRKQIQVGMRSQMTGMTSGNKQLQKRLSTEENPLTYQKEMLENWCNFTLYGTPVKQDQEQVPCLQTSNCFTTFRTDSFKLGHRDKARSSFRMCKIQDRQMSERQTELKAEEGLADSHPTTLQALPRGAILHKSMQAGGQKSTRKQTSLKFCRSSVFTFGFDAHS